MKVNIFCPGLLVVHQSFGLRCHVIASDTVRETHRYCRVSDEYGAHYMMRLGSEKRNGLVGTVTKEWARRDL